MDVTVLTGVEALERIGSAAFQADWKALCARCPWAGACQDPDFVVPWYRLYQSQFLAVVAFRTAQDGRLDGLLTLALAHKGRTLTGAGAHHAEYQAWIAPADAGSAFIQGALREVRATFPGADLRLRYLPAGIPLDWVDQGPYRQLGALRSYRQPLMRIDEAAMARQRNKKNHRQNFNRLSRIGEVRLERVRAHQRFLDVFDEICMQYDFRQAALYRQMPFASDPLKKPLYIDMHSKGLLHTTILTVGQEIAAAHVGPLSQGGALHLGILTHAPAYAAHSPGTLLLAMLGVELAKEGVPLLDLTPGGDAYKEHFATEHASVFEFVMYGARHRRLGVEAALAIGRRSKAALGKAGVRPGQVVAALDALKQGRLPVSWRGSVNSPRQGARPCALRYCRSAQGAARTNVMPGALPVARNRVADVFKFDPHASPMDWWEFLGDVMKRMERSHHLYSVVRDDKLALFCWAGPCAAGPDPRPQADGAASPGSAILLSDLYVHREIQAGAVVARFIEQILSDLKATRAGGEVYFRGDLDPALETIVRQCGFVDAPDDDLRCAWIRPFANGTR